MTVLEEISLSLQKGRMKTVLGLVEQAIGEGLSAQQILDDGLLAAMAVIGERFKNNEVFIPEVLVAARAMNASVALLKPLLVQDGAQPRGRACIGTVKGDLHDIGKNLVKLMLEGKGLEVIDLGTDVPPDRFIQAAVEHDCQLICCSAMLTTTMPAMREVVEACENADIRNHVKIMVGGAPITQSFCDDIGADRYTPNAALAAEAALSLCESMRG